MRSQAKADYAEFLDLEQAQPFRAKATVRQDQDCGNPLEDRDGAWSLYPFGGSHKNHRSREEFAGPGFRSKVRAGLAFYLVEGYRGESWGFTADPEEADGVFIWEHPKADMGAKTPEDRRKHAASELKEYNSWLAGECYGYILADEDTGQEIDSCWGFIGWEWLKQAVKEAAEGSGYTVDLDGLEVSA
jgi:hypothetical protein